MTPSRSNPPAKNFRRRLLATLAIAFLTAALATVFGVGPASATDDMATGSTPPQPADCKALASLTLPETTTISAELVTTGTAEEEADLPAFCRVGLTVQPAIK